MSAFLYQLNRGRKRKKENIIKNKNSKRENSPLDLKLHVRFSLKTNKQFRNKTYLLDKSEIIILKQNTLLNSTKALKNKVVTSRREK